MIRWDVSLLTDYEKEMIKKHGPKTPLQAFWFCKTYLVKRDGKPFADETLKRVCRKSFS